MKRTITILLLACLLASLLVPVSAADTPLVVDESGYISPESLETLNKKADEYSAELGVDLAALVTMTHLPNEPMPDFMTSYHEKSGLASDSVLLVIDPINTIYGIYIFGEMEVILGAKGQEALTTLFEEHIAVEGATYASVISDCLDDARTHILDGRVASEAAAAELEAALREQLGKTDDAPAAEAEPAEEEASEPEEPAVPHEQAHNDLALSISVAALFVLLAALAVVLILRKKAKSGK